jgi:prepilin-type N-terminal cleavage/methylation domain-containing protein
MDRRRGFTLLEMAITMAVIALIAAAAAASFVAARRNASISATSFEIGELLRGLKLRAMSEKKTFVAVVVNPPGDDADDCGVLTKAKCARLLLLHSPTSSWTLANPSANAAYEDIRWLPRGISLDLHAGGAAIPAPYDAVTMLGESRVAIRFDSDGQVSGDGGIGGVAFGLRSGSQEADTLEEASARRRALLVSYPTGIVKSFSY